MRNGRSCVKEIFTRSQLMLGQSRASNSGRGWAIWNEDMGRTPTMTGHEGRRLAAAATTPAG